MSKNLNIYGRNVLVITMMKKELIVNYVIKVFNYFYAKESKLNKII